MKTFFRIFSVCAWLTVAGFGSQALAIPQSDLPSFQYDAAEYFADKELQKVREATRLALENNWQMRITAPAEWHDKLMAAVKQTAGDKPVQVDFTNTIIESVVINLSKAKPKVRKAKKRRPAAKKSQPAALTAPKVQRPKADKPERDGVFAGATPAVVMDNMKPAMPVLAKPAAKAEPVVEAPPASQPTPEPEAAADETPPSATQPAAATEAPSATTLPPRQWLVQTYMKGKPVTRELSIEKIRNDDQIMVRDDEFLLVRFSHGRRDGWWLKAPVDTQSVGLKKIGKDKYRVANKIRLVKDSRKLQKASQQPVTAHANVNLDEERQRLEKLYNKGRKIKKTLQPKNIHKDDIIIVGNGLKLLIRSERDGSLRRYWLAGEVNLENTDVFRQDSARKYTALRKYTPKDAQ